MKFLECYLPYFIRISRISLTYQVPVLVPGTTDEEAVPNKINTLISFSSDSKISYEYSVEEVVPVDWYLVTVLAFSTVGTVSDDHGGFEKKRRENTQFTIQQ